MLWGHRTAAAVAMLLAPFTGAIALEWPQEIHAPTGKIVVYQPQPESLEGNVLTARAAVSLEPADGSEADFGAIWFSSRIETDRDAGTALIRDITLTDARWPDATDDKVARLGKILADAVPDAGFEISLPQLTASLDQSKEEQQSQLELNTDPPAILFTQTPSVLLLYDGEPRFGPIENSHYERVMNTVFAVARDTRTGELYLGDGSFWYQARDPMGPWKLTDNPPAELLKIAPKPDPDSQTAPGAANAAKPSAIVTADKPTELVVSDGEPQWKSLPGGDLLYVYNTETPWIREPVSGRMYLLLSGRWFYASSENGPWTFIRSDKLPESFSQIPPESEIGGIRTSVAGTEEANDAIHDAQVPQTAAVRRDQAKLDVTYDGDPDFDPITGTEMQYAVNASVQVLWVDGKYYALDDGVWFTSDHELGPWTLADSIPQDKISKIPPTSPVYNTTYVHVFDSTPDVVYVGYYPGYLWSFPYYGVPVYGTGWYYPPYWGSIYHPWHPTWGFHVGYNSWTGWNVGVGWSNGFFSFGFNWSAGRPPGYRPWGCCARNVYRPVNINTGNINIGNNINIANHGKLVSNLQSRNINTQQFRNNVYAHGNNPSRTLSHQASLQNLNLSRSVSGRANNLYVDSGGQLARHNNGEWEHRVNNSWQRPAATNLDARSISPETREHLGQAASSVNVDRARQAASSVNMDHVRNAASARGINTTSLNRSLQARQTGASRARMHAPMRGGFRRR